MQRSGNKKITGVLGVALIATATWLGINASGDDQADSTATGVTSTSSAPSAPSTVTPQHTISGLPACSLDSLPDQTEPVVEDILTGGPFAYPDNDGTRFGNYEGILPDEPSGYYREYTVDTPGLNHRGPLRIVTGGDTETDPDVWYFTGDHYESFCEITDELTNAEG